MATKESMVTYVTEYLNKILLLLGRSGGKADDVLFINNTAGKFAFNPGPVTQSIPVATTATEVTNAKAALTANLATFGALLINQFTRSIERRDPTSGTWTATTADYYTYVKQERIYYSPWNKYVFIADKYGGLHRLLTGGLTLVG